MKKNVSLYWDGYFMSLAKISAMRSKDPVTKVGACIVNEDNIIVSLGYNGMPKGNDVAFPWGKDENDKMNTKYSYVVHAEINAILNTRANLKNCTLYVSLFPCDNCAKVIAQTGIKEIVYQEDKYHDTVEFAISRKILKESNIQTRKIAIDTHVNVRVGDKEYSN
ncbi:Deoxycytidylate deaminase [Mycoplasmopsis californica]|uniref:dCMP deaminase family protein n=1 Tax=Mycoplasmopsis equigenitalium TaxID=114883 RepID=A0ABY5J1P5_9BACT|nr:dCMP deaminase family protein [Mycoplasmopsis equigenitalium]UUD37168.1 dCMP deaminase family protein [Mycoplasmopsis equigenitalium]VEU69526.1 Deoxycytidylate deaminase [Mycoplasmopsis californica]